MPIYEYKCDSCGHEFDAIQLISEKPLKRCPQCKKDTLYKKLSVFAPKTATSVEQIKERLNKQIAKDLKEINRGNEKVLADFAGEKSNTRKDVRSGVKRMQDIKGKTAFKKKT